MNERISEICQALMQKSLKWYRTSEIAQSLYSSEEDYIQRSINDPDFTRQRHVIAQIIELADRVGVNASREIQAIVFKSIQDGLFDVWYDVLWAVNTDCKDLGLPFKINDQYQPVSTEVESKQV